MGLVNPLKAGFGWLSCFFDLYFLISTHCGAVLAGTIV